MLNMRYPRHRSCPVTTTGRAGYSSDRRVNAHTFQENDDYCAVCKGTGKFLCCERCPRSFHFTCLNPPLEEEPEGMWFCNKCQAQTSPPPKHPKGIWSELLNKIDRQNPTSFRLPLELREYYEGVTTGKFGEYQDTVDVRKTDGNYNPRDNKNRYKSFWEVPSFAMLIRCDLQQGKQ